MLSKVHDLKKQNSTYFNNAINDDIFIKSSNNISFQGTGKTFEQLYKAFNKDIQKYFESSEQITAEGIQDIVQKYSPTTTIDDLNNFNSNYPGRDTAGAYTYEPVEIRLNNNNQYKAKSTPKIMYIRYSLLENNDENIKLKLLQDINHEISHVFQSEASDRNSCTKMITNYINTPNPFEDVIGTTQAATTAFNTIQQYTLNTLITTFENINPYGLPSKLKIRGNEKKEVDNRFIEKTGSDTSTYIKSLINQVLLAEKQRNPRKNINIILDVISEKALAEKEAYQNGCNSVKNQLNIRSFTDYDMLPIMYDEMYKAARQIKKELRTNN